MVAYDSRVAWVAIEKTRVDELCLQGERPSGRLFARGRQAGILITLNCPKP